MESVGQNTPANTNSTIPAPTARARPPSPAGSNSNPPSTTTMKTIAFSQLRLIELVRSEPSGGAAGRSVEKT